MQNNFSNYRGTLQRNCSLARYTSWKIGGPAQYLYHPQGLSDLIIFLQGWQQQPIVILGAGTNVLIKDAGIPGLVIYLHNCLNGINQLDQGVLRVEAGVGLMSLVQECIALGMIDAAFMAGIPGTVGGALAMNAGAYGDCIWNHVSSVETINRFGEIKLRSAKEFVVSYRKVIGLSAGEWFIAAHLFFSRGEVQAVKQQVNTYLQKRRDSQPLELPNCGSVFRNPEGNYAARLIEMSGLKGRQIGGARISEKHANFIVNCGGATAADVEALMQEIITVVARMHGVELIPEVQMLGG